ncbi:ankyrin repeat domain-containing protein [Streptomyces sp. NBC_01363]|uniref:ankyrin repeat domain-containing protein n=1 Tax=Streptomyces sp. NBC_01363 TaxID=2903840 RepID=UPI002B1E551F|nr:ankyrin repeat domain-containing protein [Streptomyces sp. NBC_01363]
MGEGGVDGQLVSAVRAGDARAVRSLLVESGTDPDTVDATGLPVLCVAVAAYDEHVTGALVEGGADPDRLLPDGTTPLWRAVDGGSPAIVSAVLGDEPRLRLSEASRERLLVLARNWYETGAVEEFRRRRTPPSDRPRETLTKPSEDTGEGRTGPGRAVRPASVHGVRRLPERRLISASVGTGSCRCWSHDHDS